VTSRGWTVRPERRSDEPAVDAVVAAAFDGPQVPTLLRDMRRDHCWLGLSFVATGRSGEVVGHVSFTRGWVDAPERLVDVLVLSPLSVRPDVQRRGVGRALVEDGLEALGSRTEPMVFLEGDPAYDRPLGFAAAGGWGFARPSVRIPEPAFQAMRLPAFHEGLSGALVYPDVFWRHDAVGLRP
jgi:putative acetyltransferase